MSEGDVLLAELKHADASLKLRPVLCVRTMPPFQDLLVCGISTQLAQAVVGFDEVISLNDSDFRASGLKAMSIIRLGFLAVVPRSEFRGRIGNISPDRLDRVRKRLAKFIDSGV